MSLSGCLCLLTESGPELKNSFNVSRTESNCHEQPEIIKGSVTVSIKSNLLFCLLSTVSMLKSDF